PRSWRSARRRARSHSRKAAAAAWSSSTSPPALAPPARGADSRSNHPRPPPPTVGRPGGGIMEPFEYLAQTGQEFGLVLFSGTAYEAAPPGTSSTELRGIMQALSPFGNI